MTRLQHIHKDTRPRLEREIINPDTGVKETKSFRIHIVRNELHLRFPQYGGRHIMFRYSNRSNTVHDSRNPSKRLSKLQAAKEIIRMIGEEEGLKAAAELFTL